MPVIVADDAPAADVCDPWVSSAALDARNGVDGTKVDLDLVAAAVTGTLWRLSGRQFCSRTVTCRPAVLSDTCRCGFGILDVSPGGVYWSSGVHGDWECRCAAQTLLSLPRPVTSVDSVMVDGALLDPSAYTLYDQGDLVRVDGYAWPCCQSLTQPASAPNTMAVTFTYGRAPDAAARLAALNYGTQVALSLQGSTSCKLPQRVTSVSSQGVTVAVLDNQDFVKQGRVGLPDVDVWLASVNPRQLARNPVIGSPDVPEHRYL